MRLSLVFGVLSVGLLLWFAMRWWREQGTWMNAELRAGRVVMVEESMDAVISGWDQVKQGRMIQGLATRLVGRPDQVFKLTNGEMCVVENKTRKAFVVYDGDIAELSLQAWLLRKNGETTSKKGYVLIKNLSGVRRLMPVTLLGDVECGKLIYRALDLRVGIIAPRKSLGEKCKSCGHAKVCQS